jgi:hypothetical protein
MAALRPGVVRPRETFPKLMVRVRFPSSAPTPGARVTRTFCDQGRNRASMLASRRSLNVPDLTTRLARIACRDA